MLRLECKSYEEEWQPEPATCLVERAALLRQLGDLTCRFVGMLSEEHSELMAWRDRIAALVLRAEKQ